VQNDKAIVSDEVRKKVFSIPMGQGGEMIRDLNERKKMARKSETKSVSYIIARFEVPKDRR
jgi:hypothetical protein